MRSLSQLARKMFRRLSCEETGQSLVEFAIMFIILTIILMGILDLGRAYFAYIALQDVVAEGSSYAAMNPGCVSASSGATCADPNNIAFRAVNESPAGLVISTSVSVNVTADPVLGIGSGAPITVSATYNHPLVTFVIVSIVGSNVLPLQAQMVATIR